MFDEKIQRMIDVAVLKTAPRFQEVGLARWCIADEYLYQQNENLIYSSFGFSGWISVMSCFACFDREHAIFSRTPPNSKKNQSRIQIPETQLQIKIHQVTN